MTTQEPITNANVCYRHPSVETGLRCNKCERYICAKCAKRTPVGYTCPECVRKQEDKFFTGTFSDYIVAVVIAMPLSLLAAFVFTYVIGNIGWFSWIIAFLVAPFVTGGIAEAVRKGVQKRRSRYLPEVVVACLIIATLIFTLPILVSGLFLGSGFSLFGLITPGILIFIGVGTIMTRLR